jgi:hypothetical protein
VYLNETEVFRATCRQADRLLPRALNVVNGAAERSFFTTNVLPSAAQRSNVVAVEVHVDHEL